MNDWLKPLVGTRLQPEELRLDARKLLGTPLTPRERKIADLLNSAPNGMTRQSIAILIHGNTRYPSLTGISTAITGLTKKLGETFIIRVDPDGYRTPKNSSRYVYYSRTAVNSKFKIK